MNIIDLCHVCKQSNDDMLMLSCVHNPCVNCAASAYAELVHIKNGNPNVYVCEVCGDQTALDSSSVRQLNNLSNSLVKFASPKKKNQTKSVGRSGSFDNLNKNEAISPKIIRKKVTNFYCKIHSQQQLTYYCFTCHQNICPQCTIHGSHKDHQVKLIKKAINQIKSEYLDVVNKIGIGQNNMNKFRDGFQRSVKQAKQRNSRQKALVLQQFEVLRNVIANKQRQIIKQLDNIHRQNLIILQSFISEIDKLYQDIQKIKKQIEETLNKEDVLVFQDYKILPKLQQITQNLRKKSEEVSGENSILNTQFLQQQLKQIQQSVKKFKHQNKKQSVASLNLPKTSKIKEGDAL